MPFSIVCQCGKTQKVTSTQAGTEIPCDCGCMISVPLLSQLRTRAGQGAYEASTIDTINRMIASGELPFGDACAISGMPTTDFYNLHIQCETKWIKGPGAGRYLFVILSVLFLPFWIFWALIGKAVLEEERRELGHDRSVSAPMRVRQEFHQELRCTRNQSFLKKLLRGVPIYAKLLDEFPHAKIST